MGLKVTSQKLPDSNFSSVRYSSLPLPPAHTGTLEDFSKLCLSYPVTVPRYVFQSPSLLLAHAVLALNLTWSTISAALLEYCRGEKETQDPPVHTLSQPGFLNIHFPLSLHLTVPTLIRGTPLQIHTLSWPDVAAPGTSDKEVHPIT